MGGGGLMGDSGSRDLGIRAVKDERLFGTFGVVMTCVGWEVAHSSFGSLPDGGAKSKGGCSSQSTLAYQSYPA